MHEFARWKESITKATGQQSLSLGMVTNNKQSFNHSQRDAFQKGHKAFGRHHVRIFACYVK